MAFGVDGIVELQLPGGSSFLDIGVQPDGRIVGVGYAGTGASLQWAIVRFNADGSLDGMFGSGGVVLLSPPGAVTPTRRAACRNRRSRRRSRSTQQAICSSSAAMPSYV